MQLLDQGQEDLDVTPLHAALRARRLPARKRPATVDTGAGQDSGEPDQRLRPLFFTEAERAALALTEAATRISDREHGVPDDVWHDAAKHYDEPALAALVMAIAAINAWNRNNVIIRNPAG